MATTPELLEEALGHQFSPDRYSNFIIKWFDRAQKRIYRETDIPSGRRLNQSNVEQGVYDYTLPSDFVRTVTLDIKRTEEDSATLLATIPVETYRELPDELGRPWGYLQDGWAGFSIYPAPDRDDYFVELLYQNLPPSITMTTDPTLPEGDYHQMLIDYAMSRAFTMEHDADQATYHQNLFDLALMKLKGEQQFQDEHEIKQVPGLLG